LLITEDEEISATYDAGDGERLQSYASSTKVTPFIEAPRVLVNSRLLTYYTLYFLAYQISTNLYS